MSRNEHNLTGRSNVRNRYINDTAAYVRSSEERRGSAEGENTVVQRSDECKLASREASKYQINSETNAKPRRFNYWYLAATRGTAERRKGIFVVFLFHLGVLLFHPEIFVGKTVSVISVRLSGRESEFAERRGLETDFRNGQSHFGRVIRPWKPAYIQTSRRSVFHTGPDLLI